MQPAGNLVPAPVAELAAGVQDGEHDLDSGSLSFSMIATGIPRPSSVTVTELSGWITIVDVVAVPGECFINSVINNFVHEVMKAPWPRGADVHAGALANRLEALEYRDVLRVVACLRLGRSVAPSSFVNDPPIDVEKPRNRAILSRAGASKSLVLEDSTSGPPQPPSHRVRNLPAKARKTVIEPP